MARKKGKVKTQAKARSKAHGKGKKVKGRSRTTRYTPNDAWDMSEDDDIYLAPATVPPHARFSLRDEAKFTSKHRTTAFDPRTLLRKMPIAFVSAGHLEGTIPHTKVAKEDAVPVAKEDVVSVAKENAVPVAKESAPRVAAVPVKATRSASPSPSLVSNVGSSDQEVIVFKGRETKQIQVLLDMASTLTIAKDDTTTVAPVSNGKAREAIEPISTIVASEVSFQEPLVEQVPPGTECVKDTKSEVITLSSDEDMVIPAFSSARRGDQPAWEGKRVSWVSRSKPGIGWLPYASSKADAMNDYLQNVQEFGMKDEMMARFTKRELDLDGGSHNDYDGTGVSHFETSLSESFAESSSSNKNRIFVECSSDEESSDEEDDDYNLAYKLQKKEMFGPDYTDYDSSSVMLSDYDFQPRLGKKPKGVERTFAPAGALADALDADVDAAFEVMHFVRPSLRALKKGRRGNMPPEIEDEELNKQMKKSWEADRMKKALFKKRRAEERAKAAAETNDSDPGQTRKQRKKAARALRRAVKTEKLTYKHGEVVGASAEKIGPNNIGYKLLQKSGWTEGEALGAEGNKGSLEVIQHVFKVGKGTIG